MKSSLFFVFPLFIAFLSFGNPPPPYYIGPIIPDPDGKIFFYSCEPEESFFVVIGADTLYPDTSFITDSSAYPTIYPYVSIINTRGLFSPDGTIINVYIPDPPYTYYFASISYDTVSLGSSYFHFEYFPCETQFPNAPTGFFWRGGLIYMVEPGGYGGHSYGYRLASLPVGLDTIETDMFCEDFDWINTPRISEVKPFGGDRFIELARWGTTPLSLEGWKLWADGFYTFSGSDYINDVFVLPESLWGPDFDLPPSGELLLLSPGLTKQRSFIWREWEDTSLSANLYADEDSFWIYWERLQSPSPGVVDAISENPQRLPSSVRILSNRPEPFNERTTISFSLSEWVTSARLDVFDILGKVVLSKPLADTRAGYHETSISGLPSSGIYFVHVSTNRGEDVRRITFAK